MESNKDSGSGLTFWLPGGAVLVSLVLSTFALRQEPFINPRPAIVPPPVELPIDARLWQDPFDALQRYRALTTGDGQDKGKGTDTNTDTDTDTDKKTAKEEPCKGSPLKVGASPANGEPPDYMVAIVPGSAYADEIELRRRIRYAVLAGFKSSRWVPEDESHLYCFRLDEVHAADKKAADLPYEVFVADPFDPPVTVQERPRKGARAFLLWVKEDDLGEQPLQGLEHLREALAAPMLKVIGPATSDALRKLYQGEGDARRNLDTGATQALEIYSPLATAEYSRLVDGLTLPKPDEPDAARPGLKLLRTVSDDSTMSRLLLEELALRHVDPALGLRCDKARAKGGTLPDDCPFSHWARSNRVAIVAEWDSFYSRALIESFKAQVGSAAGLARDNTAPATPDAPPELDTSARMAIDQWVMRFGYLRGVDGRLPEKATDAAKAATPAERSSAPTLPQETADGNGQLDYLRRLADHIAALDKAQRDAGEDGIGAIGIFGQDTYDKLLALQALKSRMPTKVYFSTDLDARMLQQGQARITRNLVLAAPYGLTLTRALQQDVPPFRESLQSSVYVAVLAALAPQPFEAKRWKFDYSKSALLSPSVYEIGASGFVPLASRLNEERSRDCAAGSQGGKADQVRAQDIMALRCLQDLSPPAYLEASKGMRGWFQEAQSFFLAGPLCLVLVVLGVVLGWWRSHKVPSERRQGWPQRLPLLLFGSAMIAAWLAIRLWHVGFLWLAGALLILGAVCAGLTRQQLARQVAGATPRSEGAPVPPSEEGLGWYLVIPAVLFVLLVLWAYQRRKLLTGQGLGEPMFLFEGISAWPTVGLRLLAALISVAALFWAWRKLRRNRREIERSFFIRRGPKSLCQEWRHLRRKNSRWETAGHLLYRILLPLAQSPDSATPLHERNRAARFAHKEDPRAPKLLRAFWREHCIAGGAEARAIRVILLSWTFLATTSIFYVLVPPEDNPIRGAVNGIWLWSWVLPTITFQLLVFWVVDANMLLTRFISQLTRDYMIWPVALRRKIWGPISATAATHPCFDDYLDMTLIARRTSAVNRLIYAPTLVMLVLMASRSTVFDNWPAPLSSTLILVINAIMLLGSALALRHSAERARSIALARLDQYLLEGGGADMMGPAVREKFMGMHQRIKDLKTGAFSPYSQEPVLRAVMVSLTGLGGTAILDALNYLQF